MYRFKLWILAALVPSASCAKLDSEAGVPVKSNSVLQTQHKVATGQCNESEILCEGDYYNFFPWDYSCASRREGCPVSCASGEHVCTTPAMCENCAAVQYCSTQPCPTICGYDQLLCDSPGQQTSPWCAYKEMGCPVVCAELDYQCHTPASSTSAAVNWCSSAPCPANCKEHEISCSAASGSYCVSFDQGCPATCKSEEYECKIPGPRPGEAGVSFCSPVPCPPACNATEVTCGSSDDADFCMPKEQGCPVACGKSMYTCHSPPECDNCTGLNWCSDAPCPQLCGTREISCLRGNGSNFCVNRSLGCPVDCSSKETACHWPPLAPNNQGMNWCSMEPCPTVCNTTQLACIQEDSSGLCVEKSEGCPAKCHDGEFTCHTPPREEDGYGSNWCSTAPCQPNCTNDEVACGNDDHVYTCFAKSDGCPLNCSNGEHVCHSVPACEGCVAVNWCSATGCPSVCADDEIACALSEPEEHHKHHTHDKDSSKATLSSYDCRPKKEGCPVECKEGQNACFTPPACEGCVGMHWCSKHSCPLICNATEMGCLSENGKEFCVETTAGCPVTCRDEEFVCHLPPTCDECVGTNWCSETPCATTMSGR